MIPRRTTLVAALLGGALLAAACDRGEPGRVPVETTPVDVETSAPASALSGTTVPGTVRSTREADVATRVSGTVRDIRVDVGQEVAAGQTLARLDDTDVRAAVRGAEAEAERSRAYHRRIAALEVDGAATGQELDDAVAGLEAAEAAVDAARAGLGYVEIRAPFAGVVSARHVDPGDLAVPGMPILTLVRPGSVEIEADISADRAVALEPGQPTLVETADGVLRRATVRSVSPALDRQSHRARVKLDFAGDGSPAPGSFVRVHIPDGRVSGLWVPADALVERGQLTGVYLVEDGHLRLRWVRAGERRAETGDEGCGAVEILAGLDPGDVVVRRPPLDAADGVPVGVVTRVPWSPAVAGASRDGALPDGTTTGTGPPERLP